MPSSGLRWAAIFGGRRIGANAPSISSGRPVGDRTARDGRRRLCAASPPPRNERRAGTERSLSPRLSPPQPHRHANQDVKDEWRLDQQQRLCLLCDELLVLVLDRDNHAARSVRTRAFTTGILYVV